MDDRVLSVLVFADLTSREAEAQTVACDALGGFLKGLSRSLPYTRRAFLALSGEQQNALKRGRCFIFGTSSDGSRKSDAVLTRSAVVLDADDVQPDAAEALFKRLAGWEFSAAVYPTARDSDEVRRLRVVVPLSKDISAGEYPALAAAVSDLIGGGIVFDASAYRAGQVMFPPVGFTDCPAQVWPNAATKLLDPATIRPSDSGAEAAQDISRQVKQQVDPRGKAGLVGAFCRCYTVPEACEKYLPGQYETVSENRLRPTDSHHAPAVFLFDDGAFAYSFHSNHPAANRLCNSFDWIRLHLFPGDEQAGMEQMTGMLTFDLDVQRQLQAYHDAEVQQDFAAMPTAPQPTALQAAVGELHRTAACKGAPTTATVRAACLIALDGQLPAFNQMTHRVEIPTLAGIPRESAATVLPCRVHDVLAQAGIRATSAFCAEFVQAVALEHHFHPVSEWLEAQVWDGADRVPVFDEILHIENDELSKTFLRRWLVQAVTMAMNADGHSAGQFVLTLSGPQGVGKTTFFRKICPNPAWFLEGARIDTASKDTLLESTDHWLVELGELDSSTKKDAPALKAFLSNKTDTIRRPYDRAAVSYPRRAVFGASVNGSEFLRDESGNRRFAVVEIKQLDLERLNNLSDAFISQLWAQVFDAWKHGAPYYLDSATMAKQEARNLDFQAEAPFEGEVTELLDFSLPPDKWRRVTAARLAESIHGGTSVTVGRALRLIAKRNPGIVSRRNGPIRYWRLPLKLEYGTLDESGATGASGA